MKKNFPRIRIKKETSQYFNVIGYITLSLCNGTFRIMVDTEGNPIINLKPEEVEPC